VNFIHLRELKFFRLETFGFYPESTIPFAQ
jgi:hypothetical protein